MAETEVVVDSSESEVSHQLNKLLAKDPIEVVKTGILLEEFLQHLGQNILLYQAGLVPLLILMMTNPDDYDEYLQERLHLLHMDVVHEEDLRRDALNLLIRGG